MSDKAPVSNLHMETKEVDGIYIVKVYDRFDMYSSHELREHCRILWDMGNGKLIIDLDAVQYMDSSGIGVLLSLYTHAKKRNLHIAFASANEEIMNVLRLTRLNGFLPIMKDSQTALAELSQIKVHEDGEIQGLIVNPKSALFDKTDMNHQKFNIQIDQVRRLSNLISQKAPHEIQEINLLEQQVSELIKNAVRHGNKNDKEKSVQVWWHFTPQQARLIVQDEGEGFHKLEEWNEFFKTRIECHKTGDFAKMVNYLSYRTPESVPEDGGNAMFAAIEYWNQGVVYNEKKNAVAVKRYFY
jgi:serine/threonine-protein kinase RsbW